LGKKSNPTPGGAFGSLAMTISKSEFGMYVLLDKQLKISIEYELGHRIQIPVLPP
jgi:hypothetical protein